MQFPNDFLLFTEKSYIRNLYKKILRRTCEQKCLQKITCKFLMYMWYTYVEGTLGEIMNFTFKWPLVLLFFTLLLSTDTFSQLPKHKAGYNSLLPKRKAGQWELTIKAGSSSPYKIVQCIDAKTDAFIEDSAKKFLALISTQEKNECNKDTFKKEGNLYIQESECTVSSFQIKTKVITKGDFSSHLQIESKSDINPPLMGMKEMNQSTEAQFIGPCTPDQKPGDNFLPDGQKINLFENKITKN